MRLVRLAFFPLISLLLAAAAMAQSVRWEPEPSTANAIQLIFESCTPDGEPKLPTIPGATFTRVGETNAMNIVNFQMTRSVIFTYLVRARQGGPLQIPAFTVKTDKGNLQVPAFGVAAPAPSLDSVASGRFMPERTTVWAGEVFGLTYELAASLRNNPQPNQLFDWSAAPLVAEEWAKPVVAESTAGGERRVLVTYKTRAIAKSPGPVKLEAAKHLLHIQTGTVGFGFLSQPRMEPVTVTSDQPTIEVRPLPTAPPGFGGAVGQFKLVSKVVPEKAAVGEPVTWTIELSGTGNWPDIAGLPSRDVSNDFQVVQPRAKRTPGEGKLFDVTLAEDVVLVPSKAGSYALGPIHFTYFDPRSGSYKTISAPRTTIAITPPATPQFNIMPQAGPNNANEEPLPERASETAPDTAKRPPLASPAPPAGIPRDPLPGAAEVGVPLSRTALVVNVVVPMAALLIFWAGLAIRRARKTDPVRPRREARARLGRTLQALNQAHDDAERSALLLGWQHDARILWQLPHAAPPASALPDAAWATLWREADRALYGAKPVLPSDWIARAQEALAAKSVPGFRPARLFLPQNLFPFAAAIAVMFVVSFALVHAAATAAKTDPFAAYRAGDFATAEKAWRAASAETPTNWIARHNLSLALSQQERAADAAGHATAAFVQQPDNASVRWHFGLATEKAGFAPAGLAPFLNPAPLQLIALHASPAMWQRLLIASAWLAAGALAWMLVNAYGRRRPLVVGCGLALLALSFAAAGTAVAGAHAYGSAGDARAVLVIRAGTLRSIPTEAETTQKTTALAAGSLAIVDNNFLGWVRLVFENGQSGWVRKEEIVGLWK
ncbi:MAG TPA: BatD family protein [Opitutaceae bacterium]|nr:BatD family protein [Opitutaceae bacterium]